MYATLCVLGHIVKCIGRFISLATENLETGELSSAICMILFKNISLFQNTILYFPSESCCENMKLISEGKTFFQEAQLFGNRNKFLVLNAYRSIELQSSKSLYFRFQRFHTTRKIWTCYMNDRLQEPEGRHLPNFQSHKECTLFPPLV